MVLVEYLYTETERQADRDHLGAHSPSSATWQNIVSNTGILALVVCRVMVVVVVYPGL